MRRAYNSVLKLPQLGSLPAMRRPLPAASGLSGLRFLQGPPGPDRYRRRVIAVRPGAPQGVTAFPQLCELQWMSWAATTVARSSSEASNSHSKPTRASLPCCSSARRIKSAPPSAPAGSDRSACANCPRLRSPHDGRQSRRGHPPEKGFLNGARHRTRAGWEGRRRDFPRQHRRAGRRLHETPPA